MAVVLATMCGSMVVGAAWTPPVRRSSQPCPRPQQQTTPPAPRAAAPQRRCAPGPRASACARAHLRVLRLRASAGPPSPPLAPTPPRQPRSAGRASAQRSTQRASAAAGMSFSSGAVRPARMCCSNGARGCSARAASCRPSTTGSASLTTSPLWDMPPSLMSDNWRGASAATTVDACMLVIRELESSTICPNARSSSLLA